MFSYRSYAPRLLNFAKHTNTGPKQLKPSEGLLGNTNGTGKHLQQIRLYGPPAKNHGKKILSLVGYTALAGLAAHGVSSAILGYNVLDYFDKKTETKSKDEVTPVSQTEPEEEIDETPVLPPPEPLPFDHIQYLIIGGGTASAAAFRAIKAKDATAKILVVTSEPHNPYMRPPLSKELWFNEVKDAIDKLSFKQWNGKERSIYYEHEEYYTPLNELADNEKGGITVACNRKVVSLDPTKKRVIFNNGDELTYDKCLLATGGTPKSLPVFEKLSTKMRKRVTLFRDVEDFKKLYKVVTSGKHVTIVGGGFLGSELACALGNKCEEQDCGKVTQIYQESGNMAKVLPQYISDWTTNKVKSEGVTVIPNSQIEDVSETCCGKIELTLNGGKTVTTDHVVVAVGLSPNVDLAESAGLELDETHGGFKVNAELEARSNLWAAGDSACFYDIKLGRRRVEHHDHAIVSGRLAGENMTGAGKPYWHQSMFWSDLGPNVGYEAIGIVDSSLQTVGVFAKATDKDTPKAVVEATGESIRSETEQAAEKASPHAADKSSSLHAPQEGENYGKGVIFYLRKDIIVGIVLWNVFDRMPIARRVMREGKKYDDLNEVAKLFALHSQLAENDEE